MQIVFYSRIDGSSMWNLGPAMDFVDLDKVLDEFEEEG